MGSPKDPIFTFRVFDAESQSEFTNISVKTKICPKILWGDNLGPRSFRFMIKTRAQKSHATVPLRCPSPVPAADTLATSRILQDENDDKLRWG